MSTTIRLLNASEPLSGKLDILAQTVGDVFRLPVTFENVTLPLVKAYDSSRKQYYSTALLSSLLQEEIPEGEKRIAIVDVDLFVPILTFVFGEAQFDGKAAIVSTYRLANQFYGLASNEELFTKRLEKEIVHELGHTFGLYHCRQYECCMRSSTYIEEVDLKRVTFCGECGLRISSQPAIGGYSEVRSKK